jgi:Peptidase family C25
LPILAVRDVPNLRCGPRSPLAVLVACHTGAIDAEDDCLAEELLVAKEGPVAAIAATRVTMPYGNTVLGYELLRACFRDRPNQLGEILRSAQRRTLNLPPDDSLRASLDQIAGGFAIQPEDLVLERQEHVWMYHLLGDPLLRVHRAAGDDSQMTRRTPSSTK